MQNLYLKYREDMICSLVFATAATAVDVAAASRQAVLDLKGVPSLNWQISALGRLCELIGPQRGTDSDLRRRTSFSSSLPEKTAHGGQANAAYVHLDP